LAAHRADRRHHHRGQRRAGTAVTPIRPLLRSPIRASLIRARVPSRGRAPSQRRERELFPPAPRSGADRASGGANASLVYVGRTVDPESRTVEIAHA
jgi:hypothetical protein